MKKMTEKEIIQYWVNNRKEMRAFAAAPEECKTWLNKHRTLLYRMCENGDWFMPTDKFIMFAFDILSLHEDILKAKETGFIELEIDEAGKYTLPNGARPWWEDNGIHTQLLENHGYLFSGWLFENKAAASWSTLRMGETKSGGMSSDPNEWVKPLVPKKIRFYKG